LLLLFLFFFFFFLIILIIIIGFMSQIPNLLNQETTSVSATISLLLRMYLDDSPKHNINKEYIEEKLIP